MPTNWAQWGKNSITTVQAEQDQLRAKLRDPRTTVEEKEEASIDLVQNQKYIDGWKRE